VYESKKLPIDAPEWANETHQHVSSRRHAQQAFAGKLVVRKCVSSVLSLFVQRTLLLIAMLSFLAHIVNLGHCAVQNSQFAAKVSLSNLRMVL